ncbi:MAG: hypothetical protein ACK4YO_00860, partial [Candidatus Altarchaeaceae archaeon]
MNQKILKSFVSFIFVLIAGILVGELGEDKKKKGIQENSNLKKIFVLSMVLIFIASLLSGSAYAYSTILNKSPPLTTACAGDYVTYNITIATTYDPLTDNITATCLDSECYCKAVEHNLTIQDDLPWGNASFVSSTFNGNTTNPSTPNNTWIVTPSLPSPSSWNFDVASCLPTDCSQTTCFTRALLMNVALNKTDTLTIVAKVSDSGEGPGCTKAGNVYTCTNQANCTSGGGTSCTSLSSATTTITNPPLIVTKLPAFQNASPGDQVNFTIGVTNNLSTGCQATNVKVTDVLDNNLEFVSGDSCTNSSQTVTCNLGDIDAGTSKYVTLTVKVKENVENGTTINNGATAYGDNADTLATQNATILVQKPSLTILKTASPVAACVGSEVNFTITVTNSQSSTTAKNVKVTDVLDDNLEFVSSTGAECTYNSQTRTVTCDLGNISFLEMKNVTLTVRIIGGSNGTLIENTATASADNADNATSLPANV